MQIAVSILLIIHGLIYLLYFGQGIRLFELQPGLSWPDGAWAFSKLLSRDVIRYAAGVLCVIAALGFVTGGIALLASQAWWRPLVIATAAFAIVFFVLFWDGQMQGLSEKGAIGNLINVGILVALLAVKWPSFGFEV